MSSSYFLSLWLCWFPSVTTSIQYWFLAQALMSISHHCQKWFQQFCIGLSLASLSKLKIFVCCIFETNLLKQKGFLLSFFHLIEIPICPVDVKEHRLKHVLLCLYLIFLCHPLADQIQCWFIALVVHSQVLFHCIGCLWQLHPIFCRVSLLANEISKSSLDPYPWQPQLWQ